MSDRPTESDTQPLATSDDNAPIPGNLAIAAMLLRGDYAFDAARARTVGELVTEVFEKLSERLGGGYKFPPLFAGRDGRVYVVEVWVKARLADTDEMQEVAAGWWPAEFAELVARSKPPAPFLDDM